MNKISKTFTNVEKSSICCIITNICLTVFHCNIFKMKKDGANNKGNIHHFTLVLFSAENKISIEDFKVLFKQFYKRDSYVSYVDLHNDSVPH